MIDKSPSEIVVKVPRGYMNIGVSTSGRLIADMNDSQNWDVLSFPLPSGAWRIKKVEGQTVILCKGFRTPNPANLARESASVDQHSVVGSPNSDTPRVTNVLAGMVEPLAKDGKFDGTGSVVNMIRDGDLIRWEREALRLRKQWGVSDDGSGVADLSELGHAIAVGIPAMIAELRKCKGEFYPCKPNIFDATYEAVEDMPNSPHQPERSE